jgi:hypothetical protein
VAKSQRKFKEDRFSSRYPFNLPQNKKLRTDYSKDMCPRTLDIFSRTVFVSINPN